MDTASPHALAVAAIGATCCLGAATALPAQEGPTHAIAYFGEPKYAADVPHFDYVNPDAPKGGEIRTWLPGTFNNIHPYADMGRTPSWANWRVTVITSDRLMMGSEDELSTLYCLLCETVEVAGDYSWVAYTLRPEARWHDGVPVTVDDVVWTFETLKVDGPVGFKAAWRHVEGVERLGERSFRFLLGAEGRSRRAVMEASAFLPMAKHYWRDRDFTATSLEGPLGNGAYRVKEVDPGRRLVFERVPDYWAKDLNVKRGYHNFDRISVLYFRDMKAGIQALKARVVDYWRDQDEREVATAYNFPEVGMGLFNKETYRMRMTYGMHWSVVFNTRRPLFEDIRVREALTLAYNFDWGNRALQYGALRRNTTFFLGSEMAARGLPSAAELALLEPLRKHVPERVFTHEFTLPENDGYGRNREALLRAGELLDEAGWVLRDMRRVDEATGEPLRFEIMVMLREHERMMVPFVENLTRLGIDATVRRMESNIFTNRARQYDFEMTMQKIYTHPIPQPGGMRNYLHSRSVDPPNLLNYAGIRSPAVDVLIEKVIAAETEEEMNIAGRALDRVLLWGFYVIPEGAPKGRHLLYWDRFGHPPLGHEHLNWTGFPQLWWFDEEKSARVDAALGETR
ncbi:MAG: ABC transporter substrate-binding protein [Holophagales bacterium]|nr:ABC transporter substrate-binding protein [Holophagales bacterium]